MPDKKLLTISKYKKPKKPRIKKRLTDTNNGFTLEFINWPELIKYYSKKSV